MAQKRSIESVIREAVNDDRLMTASRNLIYRGVIYQLRQAGIVTNEQIADAAADEAASLRRLSAEIAAEERVSVCPGSGERVPAAGGTVDPDRISTSYGVCPNCHREIQLGLGNRLIRHRDRRTRDAIL